MHINCCQLWATVFVTGVGGGGNIVQELKGGSGLHLAARGVFIFFFFFFFFFFFKGGLYKKNI